MKNAGCKGSADQCKFTTIDSIYSSSLISKNYSIKEFSGKKGLNGESDRPYKLFNVSVSFANGFLEIQIRKLNFSFRQGII